MLAENINGSYRFLPGIAPYSSGAVAMPGYQVVHATLRHLVPYREGFDVIDAHLRAEGRPRAALCGVELRIPAPLDVSGFASFNEAYHELLGAWDLLIAGQNPIARTNVAPLVSGPVEPSLYGFAYTAIGHTRSPTFVVAGAGELRGNSLEPEALIRRGEVTDDAMREKAFWVLRTMHERLRALGADWSDVTRINVYTAQPVDAIIRAHLLGAVDEAAIHGTHWYASRPPIKELEFEMDMRGVARDLVVD